MPILMTVDETYPHIGSYYSRESDEHVRLKNLAIAWLLDRGYQPNEIEDEYTVTRDGRSGRTDVYANNGSTEVFVECEHGQVSLSQGGAVPAWAGESVYVFTEDGIYTVEIVEREYEPTQLSPSTEVITREELSLERWRDLPDLAEL